MMDGDPPRPTLASQNDEADLRKRRLIDELDWPTRELMSNMLRVMRGAGKPHYLVNQVMQLAVAIEAAGEVSNSWGLWSEMEQTLQSVFKADYPDDIFWSAEEMIVRGSLQIVASRLVYQHPQACMGERERDEGCRRLELIHERNRQEIQASLRPPSRAPRPKRRATKAKPLRSVPATPVPKPVATEPEPKPITTADYLALNAKRRRDGKEPI